MFICVYVHMHVYVCVCVYCVILENISSLGGLVQFGADKVILPLLLVLVFSPSFTSRFILSCRSRMKSQEW